ncbi:peptidyl-prolyl cis-trans isomerase FKBP53 [Carex littledalei]|uniref:FK506-binding protein n=1 Tax=Carex littledalei TaxID=544730 RepID=A0A833RM82_9POAL|nr:peptidyl-prolyl cis-trans isomerase FKBP53 [Carex littledalei]
MAFWGVEVKPGKPYTHSFDETRGRLRISQATLGNAVGANATKAAAAKTTVQCNVGEKSPVLICSLFADKCETCHLELEFEEQEEVVFSVLGKSSVHLTGYYVGPRDGNQEPYGEDIAETESEDSDYNEYSEEEYESDFIDDDDDVEMYDDGGDMYTRSRPHKSGVVIEEILEEEKTANGDKSRLSKKKNRQVSDSDDALDGSQRHLAVVTLSQGDSEDEDGFPISDSKKTEEGKEENKKRKLDGATPMDDEKMGEDTEVAKKKKKLDKKSKKKEKGENGSLSGVSAEDGVEAKAPNDGSEKLKKETKEEPTKGDAVQEETPVSKKMIDIENGQSGDASEKESKKKKKKKNKKSAEKDEGKKEEKEDDEKEPQQSRTFGNGLIVEEISMGRPDGKKATPGSKVFVNYIGKLQNGKIFDSNVGQRPFKFRLGVGQVIKGWDVGVSGMRVGDKRRLTVPPAMGYGDKAMGPIPKNSWLIFDVELVNVQ